MSISEKLQKNKLALPLIIVYCISTALVILGKKQLLQWGADSNVIIAGNMILFAVSLASLFLYQRAIAHPTTMGFLRNTYSGLFLKLLVCIIAVLIYALVAREHVNKPAIFACIFLYFLYALLEMRSLMQWNKARRNA
ncbi:MAG TPA: hypothetical protein VK645_10990 [Chitinophagaceae bacterium]|nr:hypothetical protein [Chitinophagaceae bacterium]